MTIFKCSQSCISEGCRKIKISRFYLFVYTHPMPLQGRAGKQKKLKGIASDSPNAICSFVPVPSPYPHLVQVPFMGLTTWFFLFMKNQHYYLFEGREIRQGCSNIDRQVEKMWTVRGVKGEKPASRLPGHLGAAAFGPWQQEHMTVLLASLGTHFCPLKFVSSKRRSGWYKTSRQGLDSSCTLGRELPISGITLALCQRPRRQDR